MQRILLELLNQMDGFDQSVNVKVCTSLVHVIVYLCQFALFQAPWEQGYCVGQSKVIQCTMYVYTVYVWQSWIEIHCVF